MRCEFDVVAITISAVATGWTSGGASGSTSADRLTRMARAVHRRSDTRERCLLDSPLDRVQSVIFAAAESPHPLMTFDIQVR